MTSYQKVGEGKTLVFLHGWGDTSLTFSKMIENLQDKYLVYSLDLPGFGGSQAPESAWGLEDYADFVDAWASKVSIKDVYAIVGHSYGGALALTALGKKSIKAHKLILIASAGIRNQRTLRKKILKASAKLARLPMFLLPQASRQKLRSRFYKSIGSDMLLVPHMELTYKRIIGQDVQAVAKAIDLPTLLIYGSKDRETPPRDGRILNQIIQGSRLEIIEGSAHFVHQENTTELTNLVLDFLNDK